MDTEKNGKNFHRVLLTPGVNFTIRNAAFKGGLFEGFRVRFLEEGITLVHPISGECLAKDPARPKEGIFPLTNVSKHKPLFEMWKFERSCIEGKIHSTLK